MEPVEHDYDVPSEDPKVQLASLMSEISEDHYCAGWMHDLEFALWAMIQGRIGPQYGLHDVEPEQLARLKELHEKTGGWVLYSNACDDDGWVNYAAPESGTYFVTTEKFIHYFNQWVCSTPPLRVLNAEELAQQEAMDDAHMRGRAHFFDFEGGKAAVEKLLQEKGWKRLPSYYRP